MFRCPLVKSSLKRIVTQDRTKPAGRADRKAMEQEIALDLFRRYPHDKSLRDAEWREQTGKAPDSLYRRHRELEEAGRM